MFFPTNWFLVDSSGNISKIKFCDYQLTSYDSFAMDLIFFLYTSVATHILHENFEHFIHAYHSHFYKTLDQLGCPLNDYTYEKYVYSFHRKGNVSSLSLSVTAIKRFFSNFFNTYHFRCRNEIDKMSKYELEHIILMLKVILADKDKCPEKGDLDIYFILKDDHLTETFYGRLHETFRHFQQKGFI